jgi:uncharacterized cupin superfamily protein
MPKINITAVPKIRGTGYPPQFNAPCTERARQRLGNAGRLTDFGVNLVRLPPGNWSSQRPGIRTRTNSSMYWRAN